MACEPGREQREIEGYLRNLARWIRKHTVQMQPLNPFEPDHMWFGPTATELSILFPGMQRTLEDVKLMSVALVEFLRVNARCLRVGMMHIDIGATAPIICMRIQQVALPSHLRGRESLAMNYAALKSLNRYNAEVLYGLRTPYSENSSGSCTALEQLAQQQHPQHRGYLVPATVLVAPGSADATTVVAADRDYSVERAAVLRACLEAAADADQLRAIHDALRNIGILCNPGSDRPAGAGVGAQAPVNLAARP